MFSGAAILISTSVPATKEDIVVAQYEASVKIAEIKEEAAINKERIKKGFLECKYEGINTGSNTTTWATLKDCRELQELKLVEKGKLQYSCAALNNGTEEGK